MYIKEGDVYYSGVLMVIDGDANPVTTLVDGDFAKTVYRNGSVAAVTVVVTHLGDGKYQARFTPDNSGSWNLIVTQATYNVLGWDEHFYVLSKTEVPILTGAAVGVVTTAADFRAYFTRDFKYLPLYDDEKTYFQGDQVFYGANFYQCKVATSLGVLPTDTDNWDPVNLAQASYVLDSDIDKSMAQAVGFINPSIFESDEIKTMAFLYCSAHFLVMDIRMAESGLDSRGEGAVSSKSVGGVSTSFAMPESVSKNPQWNYFSQSAYGQKFLSFVIPRITGSTGVATGATRP